jgi:hypothetical protein
LANIQVIAEIQFLMNQHNPGFDRFASRLKANPIAGEQNLTRVSRLHTPEDFHQRAFSRAVLADDREDFACAEFQTDIIERLYPGKTLTQAANFQQRSRGGGRFRWRGSGG